MKRGKRGQFYIIAAIIIILVVLGMAGISNYVSVVEEPVEFYELGENLELEGAWLIDNGIYNEENITRRVGEFAGNFTNYLAETGEDFELVIVYGDEKESCYITYTKGSKGTIDVGGEVEYQTEGLTISPPECELNKPQITIPFSEKQYQVDVKENENFLFIISTSEGFEKYVYSNI